MQVKGDMTALSPYSSLLGAPVVQSVVGVILNFGSFLVANRASSCIRLYAKHSRTWTDFAFSQTN